jgi:2-iminobutanoate/2-iminopropanoate deaminase
MTRRIIHTDEAPGAIGPYSQAVDTGDFVFCSGQVAIEPATGNFIAGDVTAQTHRVMANLSAVLAAAGLTFDHVVKTTIYLTSMGDFPLVNEAYGEYFPDDPPARATVEVGALPLGARVEIDAIARR